MSEDARHTTRSRLRALGTPLAAFGLLLVLIGAVALWVGTNAHRLITGETATVRTLERCTEGVSTAPAASCGSEWVFPDGRTGHGEIKNPPVAVGDRIFAGDDWAYSSTAPLHRAVWLPGALLCLLVLGAIALAVGYRIDTRRARAAPPPPAPPHPPRHQPPGPGPTT
ncbi:hypothetical protein [Streptomyces buecherae]|uniref:hypothetical protein n=1 Tax=Streptomyces buecherae TaxID=2763006 RepID=UPI001C27EFC0|nr:hypothetical protein [Streptomyces buecherae]